jgi:hypothetical protein
MKKRIEKSLYTLPRLGPVGSVILIAALVGYTVPVRAGEAAEGRTSTNIHQEDEMVLSPAPGIAMLAGGGALLLSAVITGSFALSLNNDLKDSCPQDYCFPPQHDDVDRLNSLATVTDVFIPLSVVLIISGTATLIASRQTERKYGKKKSAALTDGPSERLSFTGASMIWRF